MFSEAEDIGLSTISDRVDSIALETLENNLITRIVDIEHNEESIFVADPGALFKFSKGGKFIKQIGRKGQGPGEYLNVTDITLDKKSNLLYLASSLSQKIICFDTSGNFIKETKTLGINGVKVLNGTLYGVFTEYGIPAADATKWFNNSYLVNFETDLLPKDTVLIKSVKADKGTAAISGMVGDQILSEVDGDIFVYQGEVMQESFVRDTLYQVSENSRIASLKLNFGITDRSEDYLFIKSVIRTKNHVVVDFSVEDYSGMSISNLSTNNSYVARDSFQDDLWNTGTAKLLPWDLGSEELYFVKEGMELVDKFDSLTGEENPWIFIVKLKKSPF